MSRRSLRVTPAVARQALLAVGLLLATAPVPARAQEIQLGDDTRPSPARSHVALVSEALEVNAGKPQAVELKFRVDPGFHINSHKPADQFMIPTSFKIDAGSKVNVLDVKFPPGSPFRLPVAGGELLDVYQGEFRLGLRVAAIPAGQTTLNGVLRYQACDNAACFPPRNLPVKILVTAR